LESHGDAASKISLSFDLLECLIFAFTISGHIFMNKNEVASAEEIVSPTIQGRKSSRHRILVVDDDGDVRHHNVKMLIYHGYDVEDAADGADAWEVLQDRHFDVVITDNTMPKMTGVEMIEKLRSSRMTIPVIMATGTMPTFEFARKPWLTPDVALILPFSDDELLAAIRNILRKDYDDQDDIPPDSLSPNHP
jgi:CheY-like chemotaxis protein